MTDTVVHPPPSAEQVQKTLAELSEDVETKVRIAYQQTFGVKSGRTCSSRGWGDLAGRSCFPTSDVDLLLLIPSEKDMPPKEVISAFLQVLWDAKLRPSHSVHTIAECISEQSDNAEFTISLLDRRFLTGDRNVFDLLEKNFSIFLKKRRP